jgi:hypothetical protein
MVSRTISVRDDVYDLLKKMKLPHGSFGDVIERLCKIYIGVNLLSWSDNNIGWQDITDDEFKSVINNFQGHLHPQKVD